MSKYFFLFIALLIGFQTAYVSAQSTLYFPDTTLTYEHFLQQCIDFKKERRSEAWVVCFWASWNTNSLYMLPRLKYTHNIYRTRSIRFITISEDKVHRKWEKSMMDAKMPWEQLRIPSIRDLEFLKRAFPYRSLPALFVVFPTGAIRKMADVRELESTLNQVSAQLPNRPYQKPLLPPKAEVPTRPVEERPSGTASQSAEPSSVSTENRPNSQQERPSGTSQARPVNPTPVPTQESWLIHTVKPGETLYRLYVKYKVPVATIRSLNGLSGNNIKVGQKLKIKRN